MIWRKKCLECDTKYEFHIFLQFIKDLDIQFEHSLIHKDLDDKGGGLGWGVSLPVWEIYFNLLEFFK